MLQESIQKSNKQPKYSRPRQKIMISYKGNFVLFLIRVWFLSVFRMILSFGCFCVCFASDTFLFVWTCSKNPKESVIVSLAETVIPFHSVSHSFIQSSLPYLLSFDFAELTLQTAWGYTDAAMIWWFEVPEVPFGSLFFERRLNPEMTLLFLFRFFLVILFQSFVRRWIAIRAIMFKNLKGFWQLHNIKDLAKEWD